MFPVYLELCKQDMFALWVSSGQHVDLGRQILVSLGVKADFLLPAVSGGSLPVQISSLLAQLSDLFIQERPELVIVQGDTSTTLAAALAAFFLNIPVAYVEAGLRSFDFSAPFPEEANRQIISRISTILFPPTEKEKLYLLEEKILSDNIFVVGNTVVDALQEVDFQLDTEKILPSPELSGAICQSQHKIILFTLHRRESLGGLAEKILQQIVKIFSDPDFNQYQLFFVKHVNPQLNFISDFFSNHFVFKERVKIFEPMLFHDMVFLMKNSVVVMTDSGGIFEEAVTLGKPVVCLRETSERYDLSLSDTVFMMGRDGENLVKAFRSAIDASSKKISATKTAFGDGQASKKIVSFIRKFFGYDRQ